MKSAEYRLIRVANGLSHFARVALTLSEQPSTLVPDLSAVQTKKADPQWVDAALLGIKAALNKQQSSPYRHLKCLETVSGHPLDTREDTIWCAAFMAVLEAQNQPEQANPEYDSEHDLWFIQCKDGSQLVPPATDT